MPRQQPFITIMVTSFPNVSAFTFDLGDAVVIGSSAEVGEVIGRAEYLKGEPSYHVEYERHDGVEARAWFDGKALMHAGEAFGNASFG